jgi:hypothetical protein
MAISALAALTGSPIGGQLVVVGGFKYMILFAGVCCAVGTGLFLFARASIAGSWAVKVRI